MKRANSLEMKSRSKRFRESFPCLLKFGFLYGRRKPNRLERRDRKSPEDERNDVDQEAQPEMRKQGKTRVEEQIVDANQDS